MLCHQKLDATAADRLSRFERFVKAEAKKGEEQAEAAYRAALDELRNVDVPESDVSVAVGLVRDELNDSEAAETVRCAAVTLRSRLHAILRNHEEEGEAGPLPAADEWPAGLIMKHSDVLSARITALRADDESEERRQMRTELEEPA